MGKHSAPQTTTATGVMRAVKRKPIMAAIMVPVAAGAALVTAATMVGGERANNSEVTAESLSTAQPVESFEPNPGLSVEADGQDISSFAAAFPDVGAQAAPEPAKDATTSAKGDEATAGGAELPVSGEPCSVSSSIESGLTNNAINAYRAVCANFPQVKSYGGRRNDPGSDHNNGQAVDAMISSSVGDQITSFLIAHRNELNIKYVIWRQKIYAPYTGWKGRGMEDRGSATANHMDHVHISVN